MKALQHLTVVSALLLPLGMLAGCRPAEDAPPSGTNIAAESHDHAHDHGHEEGPHGGHLIELGDEEYHGEWLHEDETGKVTVYILDGQAKADVPVTAETITITTVVTGQQPREYSLPAVNRTADDPPTAVCFEIVDPELLTALKIGEGVTASLSVDINGRLYVGKIEHHDHDHGHSH